MQNKQDRNQFESFNFFNMPEIENNHRLYTTVLKELILINAVF